MINERWVEFVSSLSLAFILLAAMIVTFRSSSHAKYQRVLQSIRLSTHYMWHGERSRKEILLRSFDCEGQLPPHIWSDDLLRAISNSCARMKYTGIVALSPLMKSLVQDALSRSIGAYFMTKLMAGVVNLTTEQSVGPKCSSLTICLTYECEEGMIPRLAVQVVNSDQHRYYIAGAFSIVPLDRTKKGAVRVHLLKALFDIVSSTPNGQEVGDRGDGLVPVVFTIEWPVSL